jgi:hypothetical protein
VPTFQSPANEIKISNQARLSNKSASDSKIVNCFCHHRNWLGSLPLLDCANCGLASAFDPIRARVQREEFFLSQTAFLVVARLAATDSIICRIRSSPEVRQLVVN